MSGRSNPAVVAAFPSWQEVAKLAAVWIIGGVGIGVIAASIDGEFGSVIRVIMGFFAGLSGTISHGVVNGEYV